MRAKLILSSLLALGLTGCATLKLPPAPKHTTFKKVSWHKRKVHLKKIISWRIDGAFSVQYKGAPNIANYTWQQRGPYYKISINSSFNAYSLLIYGRPGQVQLREGHQKIEYARSAAALLQRRLGWSLPIANLAFWIRGLPAPGIHQSTLDKFGHLLTLSQQGWKILFSNHVNILNSDVPRSLTLQGHGLHIKIVIKKWAK